jgi:hypothetical protein
MHGDKLDNNLLKQNLDKEIAIETPILTQNTTVDTRDCVKPERKVLFIDKIMIIFTHFIRKKNCSVV